MQTFSTEIVVLVQGREFKVAKNEFFVGRLPQCDVVLDHPSVSRRHLKVKVVSRDEVQIEDLGSRNGTWIGGVRVKKHVCSSGERFYVGDVEMAVYVNSPECEGDIQTVPVVREVRAQLLKMLDVNSATSGEIEERIRQILAEKGYSQSLLQEVMRDVIGYGPIEEFMKDEAVTEIMVNGPEQVYIEKGGKLIRTHVRFDGDESVLRVIEKIVAPLGRRIDESQPYVDARLPDGSRVHAIISPLSLIGPVLTVRKFSKRRLTIEDLISKGSISEQMSQFLKVAVENRKNIVVAGGTGSGKTTLLNVLAGFIPSGERIVTIEDAAELKLPQEHVVPLETRPPNVEGKGAVTIRDLVKNSLRMRPDRIIVGECRGGEALDMLQAMNTGHSGSMTTLHANSPRDALSRLATLTLMAGMEIPLKAVNDWIASAVDLVVQVQRFRDGTRKVTSIVEVGSVEGDKIVIKEIFKFFPKFDSSSGQVKGFFQATGFIPDFIHNLREEGISVDLSPFRQEEDSCLKSQF